MKKLLPFLLFIAGIVHLSWMSPGSSLHDTRLRFPSFDVLIFGDSAEQWSGDSRDTNDLVFEEDEETEENAGSDLHPRLRVKKDTAYISFFDQGIDGSLIEIIPKEKGKFRIACSVYEVYSEQYDPRIRRTREEDSSWFINRVHLERWTPFCPVKDSAQHFYRVKIDPAVFVNEAKELELRDTMIDLSGESANIASVIYKGKPCTYEANMMLIRVQRLLGGKVVETKYIETWTNFDD